MKFGRKKFYNNYFLNECNDMKRYIQYIGMFFVALMVTGNVWGQQLNESNTSGKWTATTIGTTMTVDLTGNISVEGTITINNGGNLTIKATGGPREIKAANNLSQIFKVKEGGTLTIIGTEANKITIDGGATVTANDGTTFDVKNDGHEIKNATFRDIQLEEAIYTSGTLHLEYVIIQNVNGKGNGGGILVESKSTSITCGPTTISNCTIQKCASADGSALHVASQKSNNSDECAIRITSTVIQHCKSTSGLAGTIRTNGGAVSDIYLTGVTVKKNYSNGNGGGIYWNGAGKNTTKCVFDGCKFIKNVAQKSGGAMMLESTFSFTGGQTEISQNIAGGNGGGIYINSYKGGAFTPADNDKYKMKYELTNAVNISHNTAKEGGGIYFNFDEYDLNSDFTSEAKNNSNTEVTTDIYVTGATISNNTATEKETGKGRGGGMFINNTTDDWKNNKRTITYNFYLNGGKFENNTAQNGGGIYTHNVKEIKNTATDADLLTMSHNTASNDGGAIYVNGGNQIRLKKNIMSSNKAKNGAAIYIEGTSGVEVALGETTMNSNTATVNGGAIYVNGGSLTLGKTEMKQNKATSKGGAVYVAGTGSGFSTTDAIDMQSNSAKDGGAIYVDGGNVALATAIVKSNSADNDGGAIYITNGAFSMGTGSEIRDNTATKLGGGLYVYNSSNTTEVSVTCSGGSFINNRAKYGGGACANGKIALNISSSFESNRAYNGGAIYMMNGVNMTFGQGLIRGNMALQDLNNPNKQDVTKITFAKAASYNSDTDKVQYVDEVNGTVTDIKGFGGAIFMDKLTTFVVQNDITSFGLYNNTANCGADDIFVNGTKTYITLPKVSTMELTGFDVPGELYWVEDYPTGDTGSPKLLKKEAKRYDEALAEVIELAAFDSEKEHQIEKEYLCVTLGYELVFVELLKKGLQENDDVTFTISYLDDKNTADTTDDVYIPYRKVILTGIKNAQDISKIVAIPAGKWRFVESGWGWKYNKPTYSASNDGALNFDTGNVEITRSKNKRITVTNSLKDIANPNSQNYIKDFEHRRQNILRP